MALPSLKRKVTIARPKRGRHGVFSELGDDGLDELKPSLFSEASTWSHTSWTSALSSQPRSMGPFDPEETAEMELAPKGWARKIRPIDPRTNDVKRLRSDEEELAQAKRALRGVKPGDWQGHAFAHYRKKLKDEGRWLALPGLVDLVRRTSEEALKAGSYCLPNNNTAQVRLSQKPTVQWVSMESCVEPEPCSGLALPPLVVSHKTPLEAAGTLGQHFKGHPVIVTFEASEFERSDEKKGQIVEGEARGVAQHEMFVCTNFVFSSHAATHLCAKTRQSPQERLCSSHDPAVVVADDVMLFRGPAEGGFPFLPQEDQVPMKVLVTGRAVKRPWLQKGELFLNQDDFLAFSHRLNLMTYQALEDFGPTGCFAADPAPPPVLVLSACGLADPEHRQPRGGIAQALKTWRTMWSGYFQAVVIACGDRETAAIIDRVVNTDVYMKVLQNQPLSPSAKEWHWKLELMQLSYNPVFANIARRMASIREAPVSHSGSLRPDQPRKNGRRSSGAGIMFLTEAMSENQRPAGAVLHSASSRVSLVEPSEPGESLSFASLSRSMIIGKSLTSAASRLDPESREPSFMTRNGSMLMTSAATTGGSRSARRASLAVGKDGQPEDSRTQMERIAKLRMEQTDHEQQLKDEEDRRNQAKMAEILAKAWGVAGKRMSGLVSKVEKNDDKDKDKKKLQGRLGNKEAEREAQEEKKAKLETMTLDKKRQIDQAAANSGLRFFYSDNFRVYSSHSAARWELKIDGATCPSGIMAQDLYVQPGMNPHRINGFGFHCKGVGKGDHKVTVHVGPSPGYESAGRHDAYTGHGWGKNAAWHLEAQEIPADYQLYHFKSGAGGDSRSSGVVNGRTLKFKKLYKDSRLRLFYSDNLRTYSSNYASCRWTIRVDGQACKSGNIAGDVYVHPWDNPHRPRSFAGYCDDVSVGEHTVDVVIGTTPGYSSCGGWTGWHPSGGGAHYLLEAEEIPNPSSYPMLHYKMAHTSDGRDAGELTHYRLSFEKKNKDTTLRLFFTENLRAYSHQHGCTCTWELLVDSKHCSNVEIFGQVYVWRHHGGNLKDTNPHRVRSFAGFCENVPAGTHQAVANVRQRGTSHCDCHTGWYNNPGGNGAHGVLEVHEFFKPCPGFEKGDCQGHCYWSEEAGICSKAVPCPGHDKIAVGSTCLCGEEEAKEGQFCYEDSTVADSAKPEKSFSYSVPISWTVFLVTPLALWIG